MRTTDVAIIGAGQAGLAMSLLLTREGVDHVVFERGQIARRWTTERWDSLRLLTPNWFARLPGWSYAGAQPDGYMTMADVSAYLAGYAASFGAPVLPETAVIAVEAADPGYRIATASGSFIARAVVVATGACDEPAIPACGAQLSARVLQLASRDYRNPSALPSGGVLVVGASASGLQIARELADAGREVTLSVGRHNRVPRRYRGRDIIWAMDRAGILDETVAEVGDIDRARHQPSLQLAGDDRPLDLAALREAGVRVAGRMVAAEGMRIRLAGDLRQTMQVADVKLARLITRIDAALGVDRHAAADPIPPIAFDAPAREVDLGAEGIGTIVWATGFRRAFPWLRVPVTGADGDIVQRGGLTGAPGLTTLGMPFQRRRKSTFIDGVGGDAEALLPHLLSHLQSRPRAAA